MYAKVVSISIMILMVSYGCGSKSDNQVDQPKESIEERILNVGQEWIGTPYEHGGLSKDGVDCSAFTQVIYQEAFNVELPRRVKDQKQLGEEVPLEEMKPGDLVVFKTGAFFTNKQHIGIYLSDNKFIHASSSKGVTISSLEEHYWKKKYRSSKRLLDDNGNIQDLQVASQ